MNQPILVYGAGNPAKLDYMRRMLASTSVRFLGAAETGVTLPGVDESGNTPLENARIKALAYYDALKRPVFACDSGLYIDGLPEDEQPGVHVRMVGGKRLTDDEMLGDERWRGLRAFWRGHCIERVLYRGHAVQQAGGRLSVRLPVGKNRHR
jgi:8-oxo-dGTP diphosphatase